MYCVVSPSTECFRHDNCVLYALLSNNSRIALSLQCMEAEICVLGYLAGKIT